MIKVAFGMIVFESDYVLKQCLEQIYPFASQIIISEGCVEYWQKKGKTTSQDKTNEIIENFPDPENKIKVIHGLYKEKLEQSNAFMYHVREDIDYLWQIDSDEVYKTEDLKKMFKYLEINKPTSVGVRSCTFYGGFERVLTGFELKKDNFLRIFKYMPGTIWSEHRPPTMKYMLPLHKKHIDSETLFLETGIQMYHYSYVFPNQVNNKIQYYKEHIVKNNCIDNYFQDVYLKWVRGGLREVEGKYLGVHETKPEIRGACYTIEFEGEHPESIKKDIDILKLEFNNQLKNYE